MGYLTFKTKMTHYLKTIACHLECVYNCLVNVTEVKDQAELKIEKPRVNISPNYTFPNQTFFVLMPMHADIFEKW